MRSPSRKREGDLRLSRSAGGEADKRVLANGRAGIAKDGGDQLNIAGRQHRLGNGLSELEPACDGEAVRVRFVVQNAQEVVLVKDRRVLDQRGCDVRPVCGEEKNRLSGKLFGPLQAFRQNASHQDLAIEAGKPEKFLGQPLFAVAKGSFAKKGAKPLRRLGAGHPIGVLQHSAPQFADKPFLHGHGRLPKSAALKEKNWRCSIKGQLMLERRIFERKGVKAAMGADKETTAGDAQCLEMVETDHRLFRTGIRKQRSAALAEVCVQPIVALGTDNPEDRIGASIRGRDDRCARAFEGRAPRGRRARWYAGASQSSKRRLDAFAILEERKAKSG